MAILDFIAMLQIVFGLIRFIIRVTSTSNEDMMVFDFFHVKREQFTYPISRNRTCQKIPQK